MTPARVAFASSRRLVITVPEDLEGGPTPVKIPGAPGETVVRLGRREVGDRAAPGRQPGLRRHGNLFVTYSGSRGQEAPVSIFRVTRDGTREPFVSGIVNATSMAIGPDGALYVSSRFEGAVYRVDDDGTHEQVASDLGVACGLAFDCRRVAVRRRSVGHDLPRARRRGHGVCDAARQRRGVSPGDEPERRAVRDRADARRLRPRLPDRSGGTGADAAVAARPAAGAGVRARRIAARGRRAGRRRAASIGSPISTRPPELVVSAAALVGVAFGPHGELRRRVERNRLPIRRRSVEARLRLSVLKLTHDVMHSSRASRSPICSRRRRRAVAEARARRRRSGHAGDRRGHRRRHLRRDRHRGGRAGRARRRGHPLRRRPGAGLLVHAARRARARWPRCATRSWRR